MGSSNCTPSLYWLPQAQDFDAALAAARAASGDDRRQRLTLLANRRLDFMQTRRIDRMLADTAARTDQGAPLRLALLGSGTLDHLVPGLRVGGLRRGLAMDLYVAPYGQWRQEIADPASDLHRFAPDVVLLAIDGEALLPPLPLTATDAEAADAVDAAIDDLIAHWTTLRDRCRAVVVQQTLWSMATPLFGHFDRAIPATPRAMAERFNERLAEAARAHGALLFDLQALASAVGGQNIADPALWHHAKQAISPAAAPWIGDHIARLLAALRGLSKKVLVLDLDNTLWGGTVGDDGVDGIVLGQGSGTGEAYLAFQHHVKRLAERGVVLAVSSKNDLAVAEAAFDHPEMILRRSDFAAFEADWNDKPSAVRRIAEQLDLGLDAMVFVDDNPAERELMRRTLPMVAVPELPDAPELYARCIADAGYFESVAFTREDLSRNAQYAANRERRRLESTATDIEAFLRDLDMTLTVGPFQNADLGRITQLINKTNQFNLTTRRRTEAELRALVADPAYLTFAARLADRFGDNGLTTIVIGQRRPDAPETVELDTWLMSCRVLGRRVEHAMLSVVAEAASVAGADRLVGRYRPTAKNGMVKEFYPGLGFAALNEETSGDERAWILSLSAAALPAADHLTIVKLR